MKTSARLCPSLLVAAVLSVTNADQVLARSASPDSGSPNVTIFFVTQAEMDLDQPAIPLAAEGHARAATLVRAFDDIALTRVLSSHTLRSRSCPRDAEC